LLVIGDRLLANIQVAWTADVKEGARSERKSAAAHVELVLEKSKQGAWSISSVRAS